jgi:hypothetical protein
MGPDNNPLARGMCSRLDEGTNTLPLPVTNRLAVARAEALSKYKTKHASKKLSYLRGAARWFDSWLAHSTRWVAPAMIVAAIVGFMSYQQFQSTQEQADLDVDIALLSSDLPLDAYLDKGFTNWVQEKGTTRGDRSCGKHC